MNRQNNKRNPFPKEKLSGVAAGVSFGSVGVFPILAAAHAAPASINKRPAKTVHRGAWKTNTLNNKNIRFATIIICAINGNLSVFNKVKERLQPRIKTEDNKPIAAKPAALNQNGEAASKNKKKVIARQQKALTAMYLCRLSLWGDIIASNNKPSA